MLLWLGSSVHSVHLFWKFTTSTMYIYVELHVTLVLALPTFQVLCGILFNLFSYIFGFKILHPKLWLILKKTSFNSMQMVIVAIKTAIMNFKFTHTQIWSLFQIGSSKYLLFAFGKVLVCSFIVSPSLLVFYVFLIPV